MTVGRLFGFLPWSWSSPVGPHLFFIHSANIPEKSLILFVMSSDIFHSFPQLTKHPSKRPLPIFPIPCFCPMF